MRPVHYRDYNKQPDVSIPVDCDRCGRPCPTKFLYHDGIGEICPRCRIYPEAIHS